MNKRYILLILSFLSVLFFVKGPCGDPRIFPFIKKESQAQYLTSSKTIDDITIFINGKHFWFSGHGSSFKMQLNNNSVNDILIDFSKINKYYSGSPKKVYWSKSKFKRIIKQGSYFDCKFSISDDLEYKEFKNGIIINIKIPIKILPSNKIIDFVFKLYSSKENEIHTHFIR